MRNINKVLAMILAVLTVVTMLPLTVLAESWIKVDGETTVTPEGSESSLTVTLNAERLAELIRDEGDLGAVYDDLKTSIFSGIDALLEMFTIEEILEIVPRDVLLGEIEMEKAGIDLADYINYHDVEHLIPHDFFTVSDLAVDHLEEGVDYVYDVDLHTIIFTQVGKDKVYARPLDYLTGDARDRVLKHIGHDSILDLLSSRDVVKILKTAETSPYLKDMMVVVLDRVLWNVDLITIDGRVVASEDPDSATLVPDAEAFVKAVVKAIPSLQDMATLEDEVLLCTTLGVTYLPEVENPVTKTKTVTIKVCLEGNIDRLKNAAAELDALLRKYIDFSINEDGSIYFGMTPPTVVLPAELAEVYRDVLNDEALSDELKQKLLNFTNVDGVLGFVDTMTIEDTVAVMGAVDPEAMLTVLTRINYVEKVIAKAESVTGYNVPELTLAEMKDLIVASPSIDEICAKIEAKIGLDVKVVLEAAADTYDELSEREAVQKMLEIVSDKLGYDLTDKDASEILDRASDAPLFERVADFVSAKIGKDIFGALENNTVQELYDKALQVASTKVDAYKKVQRYVGRMQNLLPDAVMNYKLADSYIDGTSTFREDATVTVEYKYWLEKIVNKALEKVDALPDEIVDRLVGYLPEKEVTVHLDLALKVTDLYKITFMDRTGKNVYTSVFMPVGANLSIYKQESLAGYQFKGWVDADGKSVDVMPAHDVVVYADMKETFSAGVKGDVTDYETGYDSVRNRYYVRINDRFEDIKYFEVEFDRSLLISSVIEHEEDVSLVIYAKSGDAMTEFDFLTLSKQKVQKLIDATEEGEHIHVPYYRNKSYVNPIYQNANGVQIYSFDFTTDAGKVIKLGNFEPGDVVIKVPMFGNEYLTAEDAKTFVYYLTENAREEIAVEEFKDGFLTFEAPHFSDFAVSNEYAITGTKFIYGKTGEELTEGCSVTLEKFYPAGATVKLDPTFDTTKYVFDYITVNGARITGKSFKMLASPVALTVYLKDPTQPPVDEEEPKVIFLANGVVISEAKYSEIADFDKYLEEMTFAVTSENKIAAPVGYTKAGMSWIYDASKLGTEDVYLVAKWVPVVYTVIFKAPQAQFEQSLQYTIENYKSLIAPAVPEVAGKVGQWEAYDLTSIFETDLDTITVKAIYRSRLYSIIITDSINGTIIQQSEAGKPVFLAKPQNTNNSTFTYVAKTASGTSVNTDGGVILSMPAETVYVTVVYHPNTVKYTVNGKEFSGLYGSMIPVDVVIEAGQLLTSISGVCTYVGSTAAADGKVTLHYVFELLAPTNITYKVEGKPSGLFKIFGGNIYEGTDNPADLAENVLFLRWSEAFAGYTFAVYEIQREESLLWLWILLIVLAIVLLIIAIYLLYINGYIGVNFLTRFVAWLVGLFFLLCLAIAELGLKIAGLFGKREAVEQIYAEPRAKLEEKKEEATQKAAPNPAKKSSKGKGKGGKKKNVKGKGGKKLNHKKRHKLRKG